MEASYLSLDDREKFKHALIRRRGTVAALKKRMAAAGWYTDDPAWQCVVAAEAALHAAVNHVGKLPPAVMPRPEPWKSPPYDSGNPVRST